MPAFESALLPWLPTALVAAGLLVLVLADLLPRVIIQALVGLTWLGTALVLGDLARDVLAHGGWARVDEGLWRGAAALADYPVRMAAEPLSLLLCAALHASAGVLLGSGANAWGGGRRRENKPMTAGQLGGGLALLGLLEAMALARTLDGLLGLCALSSALAAALLFTSGGLLDGLDGAGRLFGLHRLGDAGLVLAAALVWTGFHSWDPLEVLGAARAIPGWMQGDGALAGYPASWVYGALVGGLLFAAGPRLLLVPFSGLASQTHEAPASVLALVHGLGFAGSGLILLLKAGMLLPLAPGIAFGVAQLTAASAVVGCLAALSTDDAMVAVLRLLYAWAALCAAVVIDGQITTAVLGTVLLFLAAPALLLTLGAAVEAMQGQTSLEAMGGLYRPLRRTDFTLAVTVLSLVGVPGFAGFFFLERAAFGALAVPRPDFLASGAAVVFAGLCSLACFRVLHLAFSGEAPRKDAPARLVEPGWPRLLGPGLLAVALAVVGVLALLPEEVMGRWLPAYFVPYDVFLFPSTQPYFFALGLHAAESPLALAEGHRYAAMGAVALAAVLGFVGSALLFRKGPTPLLQRLRASALLGALVRAFDGGLYVQLITDRLVSVPLYQVARFLSGGLLPLLVDGPLARIPGLSAGLVQTGLRLLHNGDIQRSLALALVALATLLAFWGNG